MNKDLYTDGDYRQKSFWLETVPDELTACPAAAGEIQADSVIIGGGFTGMSAAIHLKELDPGHKVVLLESEICGFGASGRNGGFSMKLFGFTKGITKFRFGAEKTLEAHNYMTESVLYQQEFIKRFAIDCDYEQSGYLLTATNAAQEKRLEHEFNLAEKIGITDYERIEQSALRNEYHTDLYRLGWYEKDCAILNPARLARQMRKICLEKGVAIYEKTPVVSFQEHTNHYSVQTDGANLRSDNLVLATNAYTRLIPGLSSLQTPVFTYIVLTEPLNAAQYKAIGWQNRAGIEDALNLIHYYRLTADNRILMGGGNVGIQYGKNYAKDKDEKTFRNLEKHITEIYPQLKGIKITHRWGGPVSITMDMAPAIGTLGKRKRAFYSVGCVGHGVSMTTNNGRTLAELICNKKTARSQAFFVNRRTLPWPPDPIRYGLGHAIRGTLRLEDNLKFARIRKPGL